MQVEVVTIGDELLLGFTVDTNAARIARALGEIGVSVSRRTTVGDDEAAIVTAMEEALTRADGVITTGGIGPTADDRTRDALATLFRRTLVMHEPTLETIEERWQRRRRGPLPDNARIQALVPSGAVALPNAHGFAPGIWIDAPAGKFVVSVPGVPREMAGLLEDQIIPRIVARQRGERVVVASRALRTFGLAESVIAERIGNLALPEGVSLAYLPSWEGIDLRVTIRGVPRAVADERLSTALETIRVPIERSVYGTDGDDLADLAYKALHAKGWTFATAESCTGGLLLERLTSIPGASDVVMGGVVAYDNRVKIETLGVAEESIVAHGAVSEQVAREMAIGARTAIHADIGVGITGIAGPSGGTPEKPVGTVCWAVVHPGGAESRTSLFPGDRSEIRLRATQAALLSVVRIAAAG